VYVGKAHKRCPLYPRKRTYGRVHKMSIKRRKLTLQPLPHQVSGAVLVIQAVAARIDSAVAISSRMERRSLAAPD